MSPPLTIDRSGRRVAVVAAAAAEAEGLADLGVHVVGVGKVEAALGLCDLLSTRESIDYVLNIGVCGAHRAQAIGHEHESLGPGGSAVVASEQFVDEGVETPEGFIDLVQLGLVERLDFRADAALVGELSDALGLPRVLAGTVSTCSGTDDLARIHVARYVHSVETMEGAAIAQTCTRAALPWVALRTVSNWTGDRQRGQWQLEAAIAANHRLLRRWLGDGPQ